MPKSDRRLVLTGLTWENIAVGSAGLLFLVAAFSAVLFLTGVTMVVRTPAAVGSLQQKGIDPEVVVRKAIARVPELQSTALAIDREPKSAGDAVPEDWLRISDEGSFCHLEFEEFVPGSEELFGNKVLEIYRDDEVPDYSLGDSGFTFIGLMTHVKRFLGLPYFEIFPVISERNGAFVVDATIVNQNGEELTRTATASSVEGISDTLATHLMVFSAPAISAVRSSAEHIVRYELDVAERIAKNSEDASLIRAILFSKELDGPSYLGRADAAIERSFEHFLAMLEDPEAFVNRHELEQVIVLSNILRANWELKRRYQNKLELPGFIVEMASGLLFSITSQYNDDVLFRIFEASAHHYMGDEEEADRIFLLLANDSIEDWGGGRSLSDVGKISSLTYFLNTGKVQHARLIIQSIQSKFLNNGTLRSQKFQTFLDLSNLRIRVTINESYLPFIDYLEARRGIVHPCVSLEITRQLRTAIDRDEEKLKIDDPGYKRSIPLILDAFSRAQEFGVSNFHFYNSMAVVLYNLAQDPERGHAAFLKSLDYPGDHVWAYLNEGLARLRLGEPEKARVHYEKSLTLGTVPAAVMGYFNSLIALQDDHGILSAYRQYDFVIDDRDEDSRAYLYAHATRSACRLGEALPEPPEFSSPISSVFDPESCTWRD